MPSSFPQVCPVRRQPVSSLNAKGRPPAPHSPPRSYPHAALWGPQVVHRAELLQFTPHHTCLCLAACSRAPAAHTDHTHVRDGAELICKAVTHPPDL